MTALEKFLAEQRALCDRATPGYHWHGNRPFGKDSIMGGDIHLDGLLGNDWLKQDKDFIASSRTSLPLALGPDLRMRRTLWIKLITHSLASKKRWGSR